MCNSCYQNISESRVLESDYRVVIIFANALNLSVKKREGKRVIFWFIEGPGKTTPKVANIQILLIDLHVHLTKVLNNYP